MCFWVENLYVQEKDNYSKCDMYSQHTLSIIVREVFRILRACPRRNGSGLRDSALPGGSW